jgi:hypothetical protein
MFIVHSISGSQKGVLFIRINLQNIKKVVNEGVVFNRKLREEINIRILL